MQMLPTVRDRQLLCDGRRARWFTIGRPGSFVSFGSARSPMLAPLLTCFCDAIAVRDDERVFRARTDRVPMTLEVKSAMNADSSKGSYDRQRECDSLPIGHWI